MRDCGEICVLNTYHNFHRQCSLLVFQNLMFPLYLCIEDIDDPRASITDCCCGSLQIQLHICIGMPIGWDFCPLLLMVVQLRMKKSGFIKMYTLHSTYVPSALHLCLLNFASFLYLTWHLSHTNSWVTGCWNLMWPKAAARFSNVLKHSVHTESPNLSENGLGQRSGAATSELGPAGSRVPERSNKAK